LVVEVLEGLVWRVTATLEGLVGRVVKVFEGLFARITMVFEGLVGEVLLVGCARKNLYRNMKKWNLEEGSLLFQTP
jgi:hypothetical protein